MAADVNRFGYTSALGTTYTNLFTGTSAHRYVLHINIANRVTGAANFRGYIAANSWSSGEPTGGDLVAAFLYDLLIPGGKAEQLSGIVLVGTEKLIVRSDVASSLDVILSGVDHS